MTSLRRVSALLAVAVLLASCSTDQQQPSPPSASSAPRPTTSSSPVPDPAALKRFTDQKLSWGDCTSYATSEPVKKLYGDKSLDCARLTVPLDYAKPAGDTITLGLLRHKVADPGQRIGSLVLNPGGPGGSGMSAAAGQARSPGAAPLVQRFDLVGFDPRGVGASEPRIACYTGAEQDADRADDTESDMSPAGVAKQLAATKDYGAKCVARTPHGLDMLANIGTRDVVRDMDVLRAALGDEKLTYLGYSYGTELGTAYAEEYPDKVRALLLDGAVDIAQDGVESLVTQAAGFQNTFDQFGKWCVARTDCALGRKAEGVTQAFQDLLKPLVTKPVVAGGGRTLSFEDAMLGTNTALYQQSAWEFLNAGLAQIKKGSGQNLLQLADEYSGRSPDGHYDASLDVYFAVRCVDNARVTDRAVIDDAHQRMLKGAPFLTGGTPDTSELDICSTWPAPPTSRAHEPKAENLPKPLVISTTDDPATPYQSGVNLAKDLKGALLTFEGAQHTIFLQGNKCVDAAGADYLINGKLPADGTRCK
ncbi:alpha/beta hydrolase [Amycolatopsis sp. H20-H5]|uniref:alpha/beta hydrolase n=1 Tax=Amycolatopsis sp. H20-H5 TaxID=3046309 RepID=UPI002DC039F7|nr:alpha/beta hydrolase [Amycolatopsis sp. H20-H5]MEC3980622.1 alpha/beta hydrolase [Amycolatopsis sp. H20-H5]